MIFLKYDYQTAPAEIKERFENYNHYLRTNKALFLKSAYDFAVAEWHYNPMDHRCPHDAWIESLTISEKHLPKSEIDEGITIELVLLGAYHDGQIKITYKNVDAYNLNLLPSKFETRGHGDWIKDEVRLSDKNLVIHEIKWWLNGTWQIECRDIKYEWLPFEK